MKKLLSIVLMVTMIMTTLPMLVVAENTTPVSKAILALDPYEPSNVMVTGYRNVSDSSTRSPIARLSWKNPTASSLRNVSVFSVDENDSETLLTTITDPVSGAVCNYDYAQGAENSVTSSNKPSGTVNFKLLFDFTDGEKREVLYTGSWGPQVAVALGDYSVYFINNDNAALETRVTLTDELGGEQGVSFKIESNCLRADGNHRLEITDSNALTNGAKYKGTFKVKTLGTAEVGVGAKNKYVQISGSEEWQTITIDEFTASSTCYINFRGSSHELYIDDIELTAVDGSTAIQSYLEDFENDSVANSFEPPQNLSVIESGNAYAVLSWDAVASGNYVWILEQFSDGNLALRAVVPITKTTVKLNNLKNDVEHSFVLMTCGTANRTSLNVSDAVNVTPVAPDYECTKPQLFDANGEEVAGFEFGTFSAKVDVRNNKLTDGLNATLIVALYDGYELKKILEPYKTTISIGDEYQPLVLNDLQITEALFQTTLLEQLSENNDADSEENYKIAVMLWTGVGNVEPLCESTLYE